MIKLFILSIALLLISLQTLAEGSIIVSSGTVTVAGYSAYDADSFTIYGGIAGGNQPITGSSGSTVDTCTETTTGVKACNQSSVHSDLVLSISFKVSQDVNDAVARMYIEDGGSYTQLDTDTVDATANSDTITLETTWGEICNNSGLNSNCTGTTAFITKNIKVGVDSDASGDVEDEERKTFVLKLHYISDTEIISQSFCPATASGSGMCNIEFIPGDGKAFINSAIYASNDPASGSFDWESIAIFPVATATGNEANTLTNFTTNLATPIFVSFDSSDGVIPDSMVSSGSIENGQQYCFVYGTKNLAQNIYQFVTDAAAATTACITPSEVVGILEDKSCFISTAAFGSDMAPEVKTFRLFRNEFLLTNKIGRYFVKKYYQASPPLAKIIKNNETLKMISRVMLYPFLLFSHLALELGFLMALLIYSFSLMALIQLGKKIHLRKKAIVMVLILAAPLLKAEVGSNEKIINHESAKEGLVKITKDGTYIYDVERTLKSESSKITFGMAYQPEITIDITLGTGATNTYVFEDFYTDSSGAILGYDYEKYPWIGTGKLGYQLGASVMLASGNGILVSTGQTSAETFTFVTMPINAGAVYRFEYKDKQIFAPYVAGGGTLLALFEKREDIAQPNAAFGFGFYGAAGILFNVTAFDPDASFELDSEYGISNLWLTLEGRLTEVNNEAFSFSNQYVNAGLSFDF